MTDCDHGRSSFRLTDVNLRLWSLTRSMLLIGGLKLYARSNPRATGEFTLLKLPLLVGFYANNCEDDEFSNYKRALVGMAKPSTRAKWRALRSAGLVRSKSAEHRRHCHRGTSAIERAFSTSIRRAQNSSPKQKPERLRTVPATRIVLPVVRNSTSINSPGCRLTPA